MPGKAAVRSGQGGGAGKRGAAGTRARPEGQRAPGMTRALWTGTISFGLVTIPVGLHSAVDSREELSFHLVHKKDGSRIEYKRFCAAEDEEVPWREIARGYEYRKGRFVVLSAADFGKARVEASRTFAVQAFVPARDIDYLYFDHPYYLAPSAKGGAKAYALLRDALESSDRVGIGTIVIRQREHLAALEPAGTALTLTTMRFAHEIRPPGALDLPAIARHGKKELALAHRLIESLSAPWHPTDYKDTYRDVLKRLIRQKIEGKAIQVVAEPRERRPARVLDLTRTLQESLKARNRPGRAPRREARPTRVA
jgi:DNA end-binding protein Ku